METTLDIKKAPNLLMSIVTVVYLVITAFFEEGVAYFDPIYTTLMSGTEFYLTFSVCVILAIAVFYLAGHFFEIKINWVFLSLIAVLFLIDIVAIWTFPEFSGDGVEYHLTMDLRLRYIAFWAAACLAFYVMMVIMPRTAINNRQWNLYFFGGMVIGVSACIYSYIVEASQYAFLFVKPDNSPITVNLLSFTNNSNTFGIVVFIGMVSSFFLVVNTRRWWYAVAGYFLLVNQFLIQSRTVLLLSVFFAVFYFVWNLVVTFKSHIVWSIVKILFGSSVVVFLFLIKPTGLGNDVVFLGNVSKLVSFDYDLTNPNTSSSFYSRVDLWSTLFASMAASPVRILFGVGDWNFSWYFGFLTSGSVPIIESAHNGLFDVFGRHGIFGVLLYVALLVYFVVCYVKCRKAKLYSTILSLALFISVLLHGLFEDTNFLNMQGKDMMLLFMTYMPLMTNCVLLKNPEMAKRKKIEHSDAVFDRKCFPIKEPLRKTQLFLLIASPLFAITIGLSSFFAHFNGLILFANPFFLIQIGAIFFCSPFVFYFLVCDFQAGNKPRFSVFLLLLVSLSAIDVVLSVFVTSNLASMLALVVSWLALTVASLWLGNRGGRKSLLLSFGLYFFVVAILIGVSLIVTQILLIPSAAFQPYAAMVLIILDVVVPFLLAFVSPFSPLFFLPYEIGGIGLESLYERLLSYHDVKFELRLIKATKRKVPLLYQ